MAKYQLLDHFENEAPPKKPMTLVVGLALGLAFMASWFHMFFYIVLPPYGNISLLKGIVLFGNHTIFLLMALTYLSKFLDLDDVRRQFIFGETFNIAAILFFAYLVYRRVAPAAMLDLWQLFFDFDFFFSWYFLGSFALSTLLLMILLRQYTSKFGK